MNAENRQRFKPQLSFEADVKFPPMAHVLEITESNEFGRHIIAKENIDVGQMIMVAEPFATVVSSLADIQAYCQTCQKTDATFISCEKCKIAIFCSQECRNQNKTHKLECNSDFHAIESQHAKLAAQMVLVAINTFASVNDLIQFFENVVNGRFDDDMWCAGYPIIRYELILKLTPFPHEHDPVRARHAFNCLMTLPKVGSWFDSKEKQQFLMKLIAHHLSILWINAFSDDLGKNLKAHYIYDVVSLFNHSCAPNAFFFIHDTHGCCITVRPISKGQQIFINYLGNKATATTVDRKCQIVTNWNFACECERCDPQIDHQNQNRMEMLDDPAYRYFQSHHDDKERPFGSEQRTRLRMECLKLMRTYGNVWSNLLDDIIYCFIRAACIDN